MEIVTLLLFGLAVACFFISVLGKKTRDVSLFGALFGVLSLSAFLLEPWSDFSPIFIAGSVLIIIYNSVGVMYGDNSE